MLWGRIWHAPYLRWIFCVCWEAPDTKMPIIRLRKTFQLSDRTIKPLFGPGNEGYIRPSADKELRESKAYACRSPSDYHMRPNK